MMHLFERECSIQRRHQKLVEEAPSPAVGPDLRHRLGGAALAVARAVGYVGAGTVEFLLSGDEFWFLEVNARIQVEHPVTEAVTGLDLVRLQLLIAAGEPLPPEAVAAELRGHAIEARLYAEDPAAGFLPQAGVLHRFRIPAADARPGTAPGPRPGGWGVRVDAGVTDGSVVGVHYDPLLAKVVAHAPTRPEAARMLASALAGARVHGLVSNRDLLVGVLRSEPFVAGDTDTAFLDRHPPAELAAAGGSPAGPDGPLAARLHAAAAALAAQAGRRAGAVVYPAVPSGWRNNPSQLQQDVLEIGPGFGTGATVTVGYRFDRTGTLQTLEVDATPLAAPRLWHCAPDLVDLEVEGIRRRFEVHQVGDTSYVDSPLGHSEVRDLVEGMPDPHPPGVGAPEREGSRPVGGVREAVHSPTGAAPVAGPAGGTPEAGRAGAAREARAAWPGGVMVSPLPEVVRRVSVKVEDRIENGTVLVMVEAMKTEHRIAASRPGRVRRVLVAEGQEVAAGTTVVELEEAADG